MKIRNGFVSNSSSSSFVLCVTKELYNEKFNKLSDIEKKIIDPVFWSKKVMGKDCMVTSGYCTCDDERYPNEYTWEDLELGDVDANEVYYNFKDCFIEDGENVFIDSQG